MSKKILVGGGVALVALVVALTSMLLFAKVQPTEAEVRAAVQSALPEGAVIDQMSFAVFSDDRSKGRVSVKGTYSFGDDIFSLPTPPLKLMELLTPLQVFDGDVATWWSENSSFYPQFNGKLGEFRKIYSAGQIIDYAGELPYLAIVDGTKIDNSSLEFKRFDGAIKPEFGYLDDTLQVIELRKAVVEWRDRRRDEAAAAEAERVAKAEAAAAAAAKQAEERAAAAAKAAEAEAAAEAKAYEARIVAEAVAAAAAKAAYEAEVQRNLPLTSVAFTTKTFGKFAPFIVKSGERVGPINMYNNSCSRWTKTGMGMIEIYSRPDETSNPVLAILTDRGYGIKNWGHSGQAAQMYFQAVQGDIQIEFLRREGNNSCD